MPDTRKAKYPALEPLTLAMALERFKETPQQAKKHPQWPTKRGMDAVAKQLRAQADKS